MFLLHDCSTCHFEKQNIKHKQAQCLYSGVELIAKHDGFYDLKNIQDYIKKCCHNKTYTQIIAFFHGE